MGGRPIEQVLFTVPGPSGTHRYQLWLGWARDVPERVAHVVVGEIDGEFAYDALHDADFSALLLHNIARGVTVAGLDFIPEPDTTIDQAAHGLVIGAEQSNTSIVYGNSSILKVFRRLEPGLNPDAEVHRALHAAGSAHIATALGVIEGPVAGERTTLALLGYIEASEDGFRILVRDSPVAQATGTFSSLIGDAKINISTAFAYNLIGALFGGVMEYNSMYFGFAFLYLLALGFYFLAWAFSRKSWAVSWKAMSPVRTGQ